MIAMKSFIITGLLFLLPIVFHGCQKNDKVEDVQLLKTSYPPNAKIARILSLGGDKEYIRQEYQYDSQGRISQISTPGYDHGKPTGKFIQYDSYKYDANGRLARIDNFNWNTNNQEYWNLTSTICTYNDSGEKIKEATEYPKIGSSEYKLFYYKKQQLIKMEQYDNKNQYVSYTEYEYDTDGKLIKEITFNSDKKPLMEIHHNYVNGMNMRTITYMISDKGKEKLKKTTRQFDQNKNLILEKCEILVLWSSEANYLIRYEYFAK